MALAQQISGYTNDDVNTVLKQTYENAAKDRDEAIIMYEIIKKKILDDSPDAIFLMQKAKEFLDTALKQDEVLVRLAGVMQRLQTNTIVTKKKGLLTSNDYNELLRLMDKTDEDAKVNSEFLVEEKGLTGE